MKSVVKGFIGTDTINVLSRREALDKYMGIFSRYFNNIGNCILNMDVSQTTSTALFYTKVNKLPSCGLCPGICVECPDVWNFGRADVIWEHIHLNQVIPKFMRVEADEFTKRLCDNSVLITIKGKDYNRVIGEFCPIKKILLATDWTNDDSKISFVNDVLTIMEDAGLVSRRTVEKVRPNIMLGADPELELIDEDTNEIIHCRNSGIQDRIMIDSTGSGRIGQDGAGAQRELRPEPATTPEGLVVNIEKLITQGLDEVWCLEGNKYPIGGHIHIGGVQESKEFGRLLDYYLNPLGVLNGKARLESTYGKTGSCDNIRKQPHGIEFRTPPSAWLASRDLARITLTIVKLAAEKHYYGEDILLTDNINDDLLSLGLSTKDTILFFTEITKFQKEGLPRDMKRAWGYSTIPKFILEFRDSWRQEVRDYIEVLMKKIAIEENISGKCVFYGLSSDRGNVFSVVMSNMNGIDMPETYGFMPPLKIGAGKNHVGMPDSIRNNIAEAKKMTSTIVEVIRRTINPPKKITNFSPVESIGILPSVDPAIRDSIPRTHRATRRSTLVQE